MPLPTHTRNLDFLRGIAALGVLVAHSDVLNSAPSANSSGVLSNASTTLYIFFAVSGYLIAGPFIRALFHQQSLPDLLGYGARRIARIVPAYWLALAAFLLLTNQPQPNPIALLVHVLLLQGVFPGQPRAIYPIAWTLGCEVLFYIFVPLSAIALRRLNGSSKFRQRLASELRLLTVIAVVVSILSLLLFTPNDSLTAYGGWSEVLTFGLPGTLMYFVPGIAVAFLEAASADSPSRYSPYIWITSRPRLSFLFGAALILLSVFIARDVTGLVLSRPILALGCGLLIISALHGSKRPNKLLSAGAAVGIVSYGVYLWHYILRSWLDSHHLYLNVGVTGIPGQLIAAILLFLATGPFALGSWFLVEKPAQGIAHRYANARILLVAESRSPG